MLHPFQKMQKRRDKTWYLTSSAFFLASSSFTFFSSWILSSSILSSAIFLSSARITSNRVKLSILPSRLPMAALVRVATFYYKKIKIIDKI